MDLWPSLGVICCVAGVACGERKSHTPPDRAPAAAASSEQWHTVASVIDALPGCDTTHRGLLVDLGSGGFAGRGRHLDEPSGVIRSEHDGATWLRIYERRITLDFLQRETSPVFVALRAIGGDARRAVVSVDGALLGTVKLKRGKIRIGATRTSRLPLDAGLHRMTIRFQGAKKSDSDPYAELDWVRVGIPDELSRTYGAPTLADVQMPAAQLGGVPHRALALRAPAAVRCPVYVPPNGRLRVAVGMSGDGAGTAEIRVWQDGKPNVVLGNTKVVGGTDAEWTPLDLALHDFRGQLVELELVATRTVGTGRLVFGDPVIVVREVPPVETPKARSVVVVVLDGVTRDELPPWRDTPTPHLPTLNMLAKHATVYDDHRAPSTLVAASMASLLTGRSPRAHALVDLGARLRADQLTLGKVAREGSVRAAMFSGVPTTSKVFGFDAHWDRFESYAPSSGAAASAPFDDAASWLLEGGVERPMLAVVHARGGHPPWEVTPQEAKKLPPKDYAGYLEPRRAAQRLAELRARGGTLSASDRERMRALYFTSLFRQDQALARLIERLKKAGLWDSTLLIVTGDVASARDTFFGDGLALQEDRLSLPLYVHWPSGAQRAGMVRAPTEVYDVTRTVLRALGLKPTPEMLGVDLAAMAAEPSYHLQRIRAAFIDDTYAVRWGDFALRGQLRRRPRLCHLVVDPTCSFDRRQSFPRTTQALFRRLVAFDRRGSHAVREPLSLDTETARMLKVWGAN